MHITEKISLNNKIFVMFTCAVISLNGKISL